MRLLCAFLKENRGLLLLSLMCPGLFFGVFCLYGLSLAPFLYALWLYLLLWLCVTGVRYGIYRGKARKRERLLCAILNGQYEFDEPAALAEADYTRMLCLLRDRIRELTDLQTRERQEAQDYYTLWVHQIKTPIAALHMLLQSGSAPDEMEAELFRIEQYAEMALQYIRLESTSGDLHFRYQPLDPLIRACVRKFAPVFIAKHLSIRYEGTDKTVLTDEKWLRFILEQLLSNAVKYTNEGKVTITVTADLHLTVRDTGIGISPEDLPRIFEKGFTGQNGRLENRSTGLGLYLSHLAAENLGIALTVQSTPGKGTVFTLDLNKKSIEND